VINDILDDAKIRMSKSVESLQHDLAKIRTGRAHPSLLSHITVPYYGSDTPLSQVANVNVEDVRTLSVTPWEKDMVKAIEKAIMNSDLGLNPNSAGQVIRVPLPILTEERRRDLTRVVRSEVEQGKVAVRNIRRDAISTIKELLKDKDISEDDARRAEEQIQKVTDVHIAKTDELSKAKEDELMSV